MKLFLTSSNNFVTKDWVKHININPNEMKVTFIPTAAEVETGDKQWLEDDRQALVAVGFQVTDFTLTNKTTSEVEAMLKSTDMVFVSGGNTFFLLQEMRRSGFYALIKKYLTNGLLYGGSSAGSIVAGPDIGLTKELDDPSLAPELKDYTGICLTDVVVFPHWGSELFHERYQKLMKVGYQKGRKIVLLTDDQYLLVQDHSYTIQSI